MKLPNGFGSIVKMSGNRKRPYVLRISKEQIDRVSGKKKRVYEIIGYAESRNEELTILNTYHYGKVYSPQSTFLEVYEGWSKAKYWSLSHSSVNGYKVAYHICNEIYNREFAALRVKDFDKIFKECNKNYPIIRKLKSLIYQLYDFAIKNEICMKDYSKYIDISMYKSKNPNQKLRYIIKDNDIKLLWEKKDDKYYQMILILIYTGVRVSELLDLKKENVNLQEKWFDVIDSKTSNGVRRVPIANKIFDFMRVWYVSSTNEFMFYTVKGEHFKYRNYYDSYFTPLIQNLGMEYTPHYTRHTFITLMAKEHINTTIIKKIVGHAGAMSLTERIYTHIDITLLLDAVNKI